MEAFRKGTACLYKYDPDLAIFKPIIDTSQMCDKAKTILEELERNWPDDLDPQRYIAIQTALTLLDKGIQYSQDYRHFISKKTGLPTYMDCSSYVTYCLVAAGIDIDAGAYTGTYVNSDKFVSINRSDLVPGDVGLLNTSTSGGNTNHIGLYLGKDDKGVGVWIEMAGGGVFVSHKDKGWGVYYRYTDYDDTYQP